MHLTLAARVGHVGHVVTSSSTAQAYHVPDIDTEEKTVPQKRRDARLPWHGQAAPGSQRGTSHRQASSQMEGAADEICHGEARKAHVTQGMKPVIVKTRKCTTHYDFLKSTYDVIYYYVHNYSSFLT